MSRKKKKINLDNKKNNKKPKKILDGIDINNNLDIEIKDKNDKQLSELKSEDKNKYKEHESSLQNVISIFFTIIIFVALILLIYVLYENYIKDGSKTNCDVNKVCKDYIKTDYNIKEEDIIEYVINERSILYNLFEFNHDNITNNDLLEISKYYIWNTARDYTICDKEQDNNCLDTKKEINFFTLKNFLKEYLDLTNFDISFPTEWNDNDTLRIYRVDNNVILTFKNMEYQTLKHDIVDIQVSEDNVIIIFALEKNIPNTEYYNYVGYKKVKLKYKNNDFYLNSIETNI